ncbi:S8 family serine peptidase [Actinoplanes sp. NPDC023714]|uniref:S8 family serine peptidase n=1 Tax=Actinoplanes sp. NPDC023714 TaxID=3154322 RepID=UPI0033D8D6FB
MRTPALLLTATLLGAVVAAPANATPAPPVRINIGLTAGTDGNALLDRLGIAASEPRVVEGIGVLSVVAPETAVATLTAEKGAVRFAEIDQKTVGGADPRALTGQELQLVNAPTSGAHIGSDAVTVAVLDTGVTANPDLPADRLVAGHDFVDGDADPADDSGHGTMVAGVIAAGAGDGFGTTGICAACRIMPVRVARKESGNQVEGREADLAAGIVWAADHGARIINISLVAFTASRLLPEAVRYADSKGALIVSSAAHVGPDRLYPAAIEPVLGVTEAFPEGYTGRRNVKGSPWVDLAASWQAPAVDANGDLRAVGRVEAPVALTSGAAALLLSAKPEATPADLRKLLTDNVTRANSGRDTWPVDFLNVGRALYSLGGEDTEQPRVTGLGLTRTHNGVVSRVTEVWPTIVDDYGVDRVEFLVDGKTIGIRNRSWKPIYLIPPDRFAGTMRVTAKVYDLAGKVGELTQAVPVDTAGPTGGGFVAPANYAVYRKPVPVRVVFRGTSDIASATVNGKDMIRVAGSQDWQATVEPDVEGDGRTGSFSVWVYDALNNGSHRRLDVVIDGAGPTATVVPAENTRVRGLVNTWLVDRRDATGVAESGLWANGEYIGDGIGRWVDTSGVNGRFVLTWKLTDRAGNTSVLNRTLIADNAGPVATVTPKQNTRVRGTFTTTLTGVSDGAGVAKAELWANGKYIGVDKAAPFSGKVKIGGLNGKIKLTWQLTDKLGNLRSYTRTVIADNKAPTVSITKAPKNKAKVKGTVKVSVKASDASGVARVELIVNGKVVAADKTSGYVLSVNTKKQKKTMKVRVRAYDKLGNVTYTSVRTWYRK